MMLRSDWSRVGPQSILTGVLIKRRKLDIGMPTGRMPCKNDGRDAVMFYQGSPANHQKPEGGLKQILSHRPQLSPTLLTSQSWTSGLQNSETIHFCCLSHLVCGPLL